jgi:hypothetical protein
MDKEQLSELVFASETLQKNLDEFKKISNLSQIIKDVKEAKNISNEALKIHIESIDWKKISDDTLAAAKKDLYLSSDQMDAATRKIYDFKSKIEENLAGIDLKVLHEAADNTQKLLEQQKKIKTKNIFFIGLLTFLINIFIVLGPLAYFGIIQKPKSDIFKTYAIANDIQIEPYEKTGKYFLNVPSKFKIIQYEYLSNPNRNLFLLEKD